MGLMSYMMSFGLAAGAGSRACTVILGLGLFHHTEYFELSSTYAWIASFPVMLILAFFAILNILADCFPDISELNDILQYLPGLVGGFLAFAAATGSVDGDIMHLVVSGVLGGSISTGVRFVRNSLSDMSRELSADLGVKAPHTTRAVMETGAAGATVAFSMFVPILAFISVLLLVGGVFYMMKRHKKKTNDEVLADAEPHLGS